MRFFLLIMVQKCMTYFRRHLFLQNYPVLKEHPTIARTVRQNVVNWCLRQRFDFNMEMSQDFMFCLDVTGSINWRNIWGFLLFIFRLRRLLFIWQLKSRNNNILVIMELTIKNRLIIEIMSF